MGWHLFLLVALITTLSSHCSGAKRHSEEMDGRSQLTIDTSTCIEHNYVYPHCCSPPNCDFAVTWRDNGEGRLEFEFLATVASNVSVWAALGFSENPQMDDTDVMACFMPGGAEPPEVHHGWVQPGVRDVTILDKNDLMVKLHEAEIKDGQFHCSFSRLRVPPSNSSHIPPHEKSLNEPLHILAATGPLVSSDGGLLMGAHTDKVASDCLCNFTDCTSSCVCMTSIQYLLLKLHGVIMTLAFIFFMPTGALISRYYKIVFSPSWFKAHVSMMVFGLLCGLTGFGLILGHTGGAFNVGWHQIIGVVCLGLTLVQPLVGIIRPPVGPTVKRRLFNIFHRSMALIILNLGVLAVLLGIYMYGSSMMIWMMAAVGLSVVTNMGFMLLLEFLTRTQKFSSTVLPPVGYHKVTKHDELSESEEEVFVRDLPSKLSAKKAVTHKQEPYRFEQALLLLFVFQSLCFAALIGGLIYFFDSS